MEEKKETEKKEDIEKKDSGQSEVKQEGTIKKAEGKEKKPSMFSKLKKLKHKELLLAGLAVVIMLIIFFTSGGSLCGSSLCGGSDNENNNQNNSSANTPSPHENYLQRIEREIGEAFSNIEGAGRTSVVINWESSVELVIAYIINENQNSSSSAPQIIVINGSQHPLILKEIYPRARGVVVVTEGGSNPRVRIEMTNALTTLLGITASQIQILTGIG